MKDSPALAPWIKHFLLEYLPADRTSPETHNTVTVMRCGCWSSSQARHCIESRMSC